MADKGGKRATNNPHLTHKRKEPSSRNREVLQQCGWNNSDLIVPIWEAVTPKSELQNGFMA
jgi:hypothetical protein